MYRHRMGDWQQLLSLNGEAFDQLDEQATASIQSPSVAIASASLGLAAGATLILLVRMRKCNSKVELRRAKRSTLTLNSAKS